MPLLSVRVGGRVQVIRSGLGLRRKLMVVTVGHLLLPLGSGGRTVGYLVAQVDIGRTSIDRTSGV